MRLDRQINRLRDDVVTENFERFHGQNRQLALIAAKLEEARGLALCFLSDTNHLALVDRKELLEGLTETTDTTETNANV